MDGIRMPNAGEVSLSMRNAEDAFWQSRATLIGKRGEFFCTTNIRQLAKDIRNAPASAFANPGRYCQTFGRAKRIAPVAAPLLVNHDPDAWTHRAIPTADPHAFYLVRRPARHVGAGLPEAGGAVVGRLEPGGGSDVEPRRMLVDFPCAWDASSIVLRERVDGSDADHAEPRATVADMLASIPCGEASAYVASLCASNGKTVLAAAIARHELGMPSAPDADPEVKP